jgi:HK97 family phage prohead protease
MQSELSDRYTTLQNGAQGLRSSINVEVSASEHGVPALAGQVASSVRDNSCNSCLEFVSSDETLDRYGEIISARGWKLDNYQKNPVFQNNHQTGDIIHTLGRALLTEVRSLPSTINNQPSTVLFQRIEFATEANPVARIAYALYKGKFLSAVSVGFIPIRWEPGTEKTSYRRKFVEQELLEVSAVSIPANPNALALGLKAGAIEKSDLRELSDLARRTLEAHEKKLTFNPEYLQIARSLREILKHT